MALGQSKYCLGASEVILNDMGKMTSNYNRTQQDPDCVHVLGVYCGSTSGMLCISTLLERVICTCRYVILYINVNISHPYPSENVFPN